MFSAYSMNERKLFDMLADMALKALITQPANTQHANTQHASNSHMCVVTQVVWCAGQ